MDLYCEYIQELKKAQLRVNKVRSQMIKKMINQKEGKKVKSYEDTYNSICKPNSNMEEKKVKKSMFPEGAVFSEYSTGYGEFLKILKEEKQVKINRIHGCGECTNCIWNVSTQCYRCCKEGKAIEHFKSIPTWCKLEDDLDYQKEDKKVKKEVDFSKIKYFDVQVVKVKVEKKQDECKEYDRKWCGKCPRIPKRSKGNFVNGDNLDKIKFPCFCSFIPYEGEQEIYGELDLCKNRENISLKQLIQVSRFEQRYFSEFPFCNLGEIIKMKKVKILKGQVKIFEEEK